MTGDRRPVVRAPEAAWRRLGELLQLRRAELGYRRRPAFTREHGINIRLVTDIENAYRPNTFLTPTLRDIAQAYQVTYDSVIAVLLGRDDELTGADPADSLAGRVPPVIDPARLAADQPYMDRIQARLDLLRAQGNAAPSGAQLFPDSPADAADWDKYADWDLPLRTLFLADLQRRADGRGPGSAAGTAGGLMSREGTRGTAAHDPAHGYRIQPA